MALILVKCRFCCRNGSTLVNIPTGSPVRCTFCKRVQPETARVPEVEPVSGPDAVVSSWFNRIK